MKEVIDYLIKDMSAFTLWKIDKLTDIKVFFASLIIGIKKRLFKENTDE